MSQIFIPSASMPPPPQVPTTFVTDSGSATPAANTLSVLGIDATTDIDNGIRTTGSGSAVNVVLTNRTTGTATTPAAALTTIVTLPLGATPGVFYVSGNVQGFAAVGPSAATYSFSGGYRTDGATATELGTEYHDTFEDPGFVTADIFLTTSGNDVLLQVQGVLATSIDWNSLLEFRKVT